MDDHVPADNGGHQIHGLNGSYGPVPVCIPQLNDGELSMWLTNLVGYHLRLVLPEVEHRLRHAIDQHLRVSAYGHQPKQQQSCQETVQNDLALLNFGRQSSWPPPDENVHTPRAEDSTDHRVSAVTQSFSYEDSSNSSSQTKDDSEYHEGVQDAVTAVLNFVPRNWVQRRVASAWARLGNLKEPERKGRLHDICTSKGFEFSCTLVIVLNAICSAYQADSEIQRIAKAKNGTLSTKLNNEFAWAEAAFCIFYLVELALKIILHRGYFFINQEWRWNVFDFTLVTLGLYDQGFTVFSTVLGLQTSSSNQKGGAQLTFMRLLRLMKLGKAMRLFRVLRFFRELRMLMLAIGRSFASLFWCCVMLWFILYFFGLVMLQGVIGYLSDQGQAIDVKSRTDMLERYGSMSRTMVSLYMSATGGADWEAMYLLASKTGTFYAACFLFYITFFMIAIGNILTGMFVDSVLTLGERDDQSRVLQWRHDKNQLLQKTKKLFQCFDEDGDGMISREEFMFVSENDQVQAFLKELELEPPDAILFFDMLRAHSDHPELVDINTFVDGIIKLKGGAKSIDVHFLRLATDGIKDELEQVRQLCTLQPQASFQAAPDSQPAAVRVAKPAASRGSQSRQKKNRFVTVVSASNLKNIDAWRLGMISPYCVIKVNGVEHFRTDVTKHSQSPVWHCSRKIPITPFCKLQFEVWDKHPISDVLLGDALLDLSCHPRGFNGNLILSGEESSGTIKVKVTSCRPPQDSPVGRRFSSKASEANNPKQAISDEMDKDAEVNACSVLQHRQTTVCEQPNVLPTAPDQSQLNAVKSRLNTPLNL